MDTPLNADGRFRARISLLMQAIGWSTLACSTVSFLLTWDIVVLVSSIWLGILPIIWPRREADVSKLFVLLHPSLLYTGTTWLYALSTLNLPLEGFVNAGLAFTIAAVYQAAIFSAYLLSKLLPIGRDTVVTDLRSPLPRARRAWLLTAFGSSLYVVAAISEAAKGYSPVAATIFFVGLGYLIVSRKNIGWIVLISLAFVFTISLTTNERTGIFLTLFFWAVVFAYRMPHIFTLRNAALLVVAFGALNWVTYSFITARTDVAEGNAQEPLTRTVEVAFSPLGLTRLIPFWPQDEEVSSFSARSGRYYSLFLRANSDQSENFTTAGRFALLAHMDIATGRLGLVDHVDWNELGLLVPSALPDFGQRKNLIYSDQVIWGLGLRPKETVARPLITVAGEFYSLGGLAVLFFASMAVFFVVFLELSILRKILGYNFIYVTASLTVIYSITFTGTALGSVLIVFRYLPILLIFLTLVTTWITKRRYQLGPVPGRGVADR